MPNLTPSDVHVMVPVGTDRHSFSQDEDSNFQRKKKARKKKIAVSGQKINPLYDGSIGVPIVSGITVEKRFFSAETRRGLASKGQALSDGSYPIPDADALRRAAILARSGHGNVSAAKALIARRAKELGVSNPLAEDTSVSKVLAGRRSTFIPVYRALITE